MLGCKAGVQPKYAAAFLLVTLAVVQRFGPLVQFDAGVSAGAYDAALAHPAWRSVMHALT